MAKVLTKKWRIVLVFSIIAALCIFSLFIYQSSWASTVDLLDGNGRLDNTNQYNLWNYAMTTGTTGDSFQLDPAYSAIGGNGGRIDVNKNASGSANFSQSITYNFTPKKDVTSATLDLHWLRTVSGSLSSSSITAEIYRVSDQTSLQTIQIDSGITSTSNYTAMSNIAITAQLVANTQYELRLSVDGNGQKVSYYFDEVYLNAVLGGTPPVVKSAQVVDDSTVNVVFDKTLDIRSAEAIGNYTISPFLKVKTATLQSDGLTIKLTTDPQTFGVGYTVTVSNIKSSSGDQMTTPGTASFTGTDNTPPKMLAAYSVDHSTVNLLFNENLDPTSVSNVSNYIFDNGLTVASATLLTDNRTVQLQTSAQNKVLYSLNVTNIKDNHNNALSSVNTSFTGTAAVDNTPPMVVSAVAVSDTLVDVKFSEAVDGISALNTANYNISPNLVITDAAIQPDGATVRLTTGIQVGSTLYNISVNNVTDQAANPVAAGSTVEFTGVDTTSPAVLSSAAIDDVTVKLIFSEALDPISAGNISNYLISPNLTVNSAVLQLDEKTVLLNTSAQVASTAYNVTVSGVKDLANNSIGSNNTTTFTGVGSDVTAPTIVSANALNNQRVDVVFSEKMDSVTTQNLANYKISPALSVNSALLKGDGKTVELATAVQTANVSYTLTVTDVQDQQRNNISPTGNIATFTGSSVLLADSPHGNYKSDTNECKECHDTHDAAGSKLIKASSQTTLCYLCHDASGKSIYDVADEFGQPDPRTSHHKIPEGNQNCTDCHDPHGVIDDNLNPVPALLRVKTKTGVNSGSSFCLACHQNAMGSTKAIFSTLYPADGIGHNSSALNAGSGTNIRCEGCHEKHSSDLTKLLKKDPNGDNITVTGDDKSFCAECHKNSSSDNRYLGIDIFNNSTYSKHSLTTSTNTTASFPGVTGQAGQCQNCHDPHGTAYGTSKVSMKTLRASYEDGVTNYTVNNFTLCFQCHNSSSANSKYDIKTKYTDGYWKGGHYIKTAGGNLQVGSKIPCEDCHSIHGSANNNKYMLKDSLGANLGDGRNECLACHATGKVVEGLTMTFPNVYEHNENPSTPCLDCHDNSHNPNDGISRGGQDCGSCHSTIATAMKSTASGYHHLMVNTSPTYGTAQTNKNCLSCHVDHNKFNFNNGSQRAYNLKQNYTQSFSTTDRTTTGAANSDFNPSDATYGGICLSCHQTKQTKTYTQSGNPETPVIGINNFVNANAHNYTVQSTFIDGTTFDAVCSKCHNDNMNKIKQTSTNKFSTHNSTLSSILTPFGDGSLTDPMNEKFCYKCHGTNNPNNSTGKDYYGVTNMTTTSLVIQDKFTTTTNLSTPSSHNLNEMRCVSCHNTHNVSKRDAGGNAQTATTSIYSDPSNTLNPFTAASGDVVAFCLKCHTSGTKPTANNTATTYVPMTQIFTDPSPNGFTNNGSGWYKDMFTTGTHYNNTIKKVLCNDCHDPHGSSNPLLRKLPDDTATTDGDCFKCHNGSITGIPNIKNEFLKADKHPSLSTTAGTHTVTENYNLLGNTSRHAKCEDCHDPHSLDDGYTTLSAAISTTGATSFTVADGTQIPNTNGATITVGTGTANVEFATVSSISGNTITVSPALTKTHASGDKVSVAAPTRAGMIKNVSGVAVGARAAWTSLTYNSTTYTFKKSVDNEYELCYKCHSTYAWGTTPPTASSGGAETDIPQQFNTANVSYHPVEGPTKNTWTYITQENFNTISPFRKANAGKQTMYCFDCHGDDQQQADGYTPKVRGPHGSANIYLLKKPYTAGSANNVKNDLCTMCHATSVYDSPTTANGNATGFRVGTTNYHLEHRNALYPSYAGGSGTWFCGDCHGLYVHGQQRPHLIVYQTDPAPYNAWSALVSYTNPTPGNYTETSCRVGPNPRTGTKCYGGH